MEDDLFKWLMLGGAALVAILTGVILVTCINWSSIESEAKKIMAKKGIKDAEAKIRGKILSGDYTTVDIGLTSGNQEIQFSIKSKNVDKNIQIGQTRRLMA